MFLLQMLHPTSPVGADKFCFSMNLATQMPQLQRSLQRLFVRLCEASFQFPQRLWLANVRLVDRQPVNGGAFGEIYIGEYGGSQVALKALRIFRHRDEETKNRKVGEYREHCGACC